MLAEPSKQRDLFAEPGPSKASGEYWAQYLVGGKICSGSSFNKLGRGVSPSAFSFVSMINASVFLSMVKRKRVLMARRSAELQDVCVWGNLE